MLDTESLSVVSGCTRVDHFVYASHHGKYFSECSCTFSCASRRNFDMVSPGRWGWMRHCREAWYALQRAAEELRRLTKIPPSVDNRSEAPCLARKTIARTSDGVASRLPQSGTSVGCAFPPPQSGAWGIGLRRAKI